MTWIKEKFLADGSWPVRNRQVIQVGWVQRVVIGRWEGISIQLRGRVLLRSWSLDLLMLFRRLDKSLGIAENIGHIDTGLYERAHIKRNLYWAVIEELFQNYLKLDQLLLQIAHHSELGSCTGSCYTNFRLTNLKASRLDAMWTLLLEDSVARFGLDESVFFSTIVLSAILATVLIKTVCPCTIAENVFHNF